jgi:hypothetical protein
MATMADLSLVLTGAPSDRDDDYARLSKLASKTTEAARSERREIMKRNPDLALRLGDAARHLETQVIESFGGGAVLSDALPEKCRAMRRELGYREGSELERLLIDRIVFTWLRVQVAENDRQASTNGTTLKKAAFYHNEASRALADHTRAVTALARVRRLLRPSIAQINIAADGGQQVNQVVDTA